MRSLGVGISNAELGQIPIASDSVPVPPDAPKSWKVTRTFNGSTDRNTDVFNILGDSFQIQWNYTGDGYFGITLYSKDGDYLELIANEIGPKSETTHVYERGEMYLDISASDNYEIGILEYQ